MTEELFRTAAAAVRMNRLRLTIVFVGFGVLIVAFYGLSDAGDRAATVLAVLHQLRDFGVLGWIIFIGLQTLVALVGFLPASLLGIAAGAIYGMVLGFGLSAIGVVIGAEISFLLARSALRPKITKLLEKRAMFKKLDQAVTQDGWRLVLLLRVSPVMPFSLTSFALGLSGIRRQAYSFGTLASLPALLLYVVAGHLGKTSIAALHRGTSILHLLVLCVGIISTIFLTVRGGHLIARAIRCP